MLFGVGWGLTGFCPGPLLVGLVGAPQLNSLIVFAALCAGTALASVDAFQQLVAPSLV